MRFIPSIVYAVSIFTSSLNTVASENSFDSLVSHEDGRAARFLLDKGTDCSSTANVECVLRGTGGLPCENNMRVKKSDCDSMENRVMVRVKVRWTYCNTDTMPQTPYKNKVIAMYKTDKLDKNDIDLSPIPAKTCRNYRRNKKMNYCTQGATMRLKYEGWIESRDNSYCFAFKYLRVRRELLPEDKEACGTTTEISCKLRGGDMDNENCNGNIVKSDTCKSIDVKFEYQYCNWNPTVGNNEKDLKFDRQQSWIKLGNEKQTPMIRTLLTTKEKCRIKVVNSSISTCNNDPIIAQMKVRGSILNNKACGSNSKLIIAPLEECDSKFFMTEIVTDNDNGGSFIEIYSPNCADKTITKYYHLVRYAGGADKPKLDVIALKGATFNQHGFMTFCSAREADNLYGVGKCNYFTGIESPADNRFDDTIAILEGDIEGPYTIYDIFGSSKKGEGGPLKNNSKSRGLRKKNGTYPSEPYDFNEWFIKDREDVDPGAWFNIGPIIDPSPPAVDDNRSGSPAPGPNRSPVNIPTARPSRSPVNNPAASPLAGRIISAPSSAPSRTSTSTGTGKGKGGGKGRGSGKGRTSPPAGT